MREFFFGLWTTAWLSAVALASLVLWLGALAGLALVALAVVRVALS